MMNVGESFRCSRCGRDSVAKTKRLLDGWRLLGERLVCAFCEAEIPGADSPPDAAVSSTGRDALADLLGENVPTGEPSPLDDVTDAHFCKDCRHFLRHPFLSQCLLHKRSTEPMADCADFLRRVEPEETGDSHA